MRHPPFEWIIGGVTLERRPVCDGTSRLAARTLVDST
jgi:hypothetical protein